MSCLCLSVWARENCAQLRVVLHMSMTCSAEKRWKIHKTIHKYSEITVNVKRKLWTKIWCLLWKEIEFINKSNKGIPFGHIKIEILSGRKTQEAEKITLMNFSDEQGRTTLFIFRLINGLHNLCSCWFSSNHIRNFGFIYKQNGKPTLMYIKRNGPHILHCFYFRREKDVLRRRIYIWISWLSRARRRLVHEHAQISGSPFFPNNAHLILHWILKLCRIAFCPDNNHRCDEKRTQMFFFFHWKNPTFILKAPVYSTKFLHSELPSKTIMKIKQRILRDALIFIWHMNE